ncbi:MAG: hypothetical protein AB7V50_05915 [Vampirovibrionia bacterium]
MTEINNTQKKQQPVTAAQADNIAKKNNVSNQEIGFFEAFFMPEKDEEEIKKKKNEEHLATMKRLDNEYQEYNTKNLKEEKVSQIKAKLSSNQALNPKEKAELESQRFLLEAELDKLG